MAQNARLCPVCKCYAKQWKNSLVFFGSVAGVVAVVASGIAFMTGQADDWYRWLTWQDSIRATYFEYPGYSGYLNTGSGDVILESVMIEWPGEPGKTVTIQVNTPVKKGDFVLFEGKSPFGKPLNSDAGVWAVSDDGTASPKLTRAAIDRGKQDRCAEYHFHNAEHLVFKRIADLQENGKLIAVPATAIFNIVSLVNGHAQAQAVSLQTAFLKLPRNPGCNAL